MLIDLIFKEAHPLILIITLCQNLLIPLPLLPLPATHSKLSTTMHLVLFIPMHMLMSMHILVYCLEVHNLISTFPLHLKHTEPVPYKTPGILSILSTSLLTPQTTHSLVSTL